MYEYSEWWYFMIKEEICTKTLLFRCNLINWCVCMFWVLCEGYTKKDAHDKSKQPINIFPFSLSISNIIACDKIFTITVNQLSSRTVNTVYVFFCMLQIPVLFSWPPCTDCKNMAKNYLMICITVHNWWILLKVMQPYPIISTHPPPQKKMEWRATFLQLAKLRHLIFDLKMNEMVKTDS